MRNKSKEIRDAIRKICGIDNQGLIFFNAEVVSVDSDTCTVKRNNINHTDVRLTAVIDGNHNKLLVKPKVGSMVLIADLSEGLMRDLAVIAWSEVESLRCKTGNISIEVTETGINFNDGTEGIAKLSQLISWMRNVKTDLTTISTALNTLQVPVVIKTPTPVQSNFEDAKIKH